MSYRILGFVVIIVTVILGFVVIVVTGIHGTTICTRLCWPQTSSNEVVGVFKLRVLYFLHFICWKTDLRCLTVADGVKAK